MPLTVHPRVCGEQGRIKEANTAFCGSSPRVRGTDRATKSCGAQRRFIPACAGNRVNVSTARLRKPVHPRVCGEQPFAEASQAWQLGSSPRVRGTGVDDGGHQIDIRFIPACAGNSTGSGRRLVPLPVHPRVCGEQNHANSAICCRKRFIPACAGNRQAQPARRVARAVHPRVCGEQFGEVLREVTRDGSSPRVRGTDVPDLPTDSDLRFIPACAGNSPHRPGKRKRYAVHPRVCGEQIIHRRHPPNRRGSSPRVRGTAEL